MIQSFELFPSDICRVRSASCGGKLESTFRGSRRLRTCDGFSSDACKRVVKTINYVDIGELSDASLPGAVQRSRSNAKIVKNRRSIGEKLIKRDIEISILAAKLRNCTKYTRYGITSRGHLCNALLHRQNRVFNFPWARKEEKATKI